MKNLILLALSKDKYFYNEIVLNYYQILIKILKLDY